MNGNSFGRHTAGGAVDVRAVDEPWDTELCSEAWVEEISPQLDYAEYVTATGRHLQ